MDSILMKVGQMFAEAKGGLLLPSFYFYSENCREDS